MVGGFFYFIREVNFNENQTAKNQKSYAPVPSGMRGTVTFVDDVGTVHMKWDNGRTLGIVPNVDDFRKLSGDEIEAEKVQTEENNIVRMNL